ncbi:MAG: response regulator [Bacteriovoracaceae bacterium]|nr:response regulator [Bacteriovoracaceae bacterium]
MNSLSKNRLVLVVDDEEDVRETLSDGLEKNGFKIKTAEGGTHAFNIILDDFVDVVITDLSMANGMGRDLLRRLKDLPYDDRPLVYVISGYDELTSDEIQKFKVKKFIQKPFSINSLIETVSTNLKDTITKK